MAWLLWVDDVFPLVGYVVACLLFYRLAHGRYGELPHWRWAFFCLTLMALSYAMSRWIILWQASGHCPWPESAWLPLVRVWLVDVAVICLVLAALLFWRVLRLAERELPRGGGTG